MKKKVKDIVGDSTGKEAAKKLAEWLSDNQNYYYYCNPPRCGKTLKQELEWERRKALNCEDERVTKLKKDLLLKGQLK